MLLARVIIFAVASCTATIASREQELINELQVKLAALESWRAEQETNGRKLKELVALGVNTQGRRATTPVTHGVALDYMWLIICGALVMFMQAGFAMLESGTCQDKNRALVMLKNMIDVCLGTLVWYFVGYAFAYGATAKDPNTFIGTELFAGAFGENDVGGFHYKDWFFQWAFCATAATIVSGGVAERIKFHAYVLYSVIMTGVIYPVVVYWTWSGKGWLTIGGGSLEEPNGYSDFAGSGIVHMTGGIAALVGAIILGPRAGRFERPEEFIPHDISLVVLGTFILWFGWYGFNCGSTLTFSDAATATQGGIIAMNTTVSAAAGGVTVFSLRLRKKSYCIAGMCNGILAGLVAVCAGVGDITPFAALCTGFLGGLAMECASVALQLLKVDDPLDAFAVHGAGGFVGVMTRPLFDQTGVQGDMLLWHFIGAIAISAWSGSITAIVFGILKATKQLRVDEEEEKVGGDAMVSGVESPKHRLSLDLGQLPVDSKAAVASVTV